MKSLAVILVYFLANIFQTTALVHLHNQQHGVISSVLSAAYPGSAGSQSSRGGRWTVPSKTARESAVNVEWEPMTELERRIEDGVNYEHIPRQGHKQNHDLQDSQNALMDDEDDTPTTQGIFCGYRHTPEEYERLKSADPRQ